MFFTRTDAPTKVLYRPSKTVSEDMQMEEINRVAKLNEASRIDKRVDLLEYALGTPGAFADFNITAEEAREELATLKKSQTQRDYTEIEHQVQILETQLLQTKDVHQRALLEQTIANYNSLLVGRK